MGEDKKKKSDGNRPWRSGNTNQPARSVVKAYKAPTVGLESVVFKMGTVQDAADFEDHKKDLGRYIAVNFKEGGSLLQQAMENMVAPTFTPPTDPIDPTNVVQVKKWEREYDAFTKKEAAWDAVKSRGFQLILQHCDKDVEQRIESYGNWEVCNASQDPIELLKLIRSALHKHDDIKQGTMAFVEQDIRLFTMWQKPEQSPLEFVKQVKAQADVINVHGGRAGYHPELYKAHLAEWMDINNEDATTGPSTASEKAAMESSCEEYLACFAVRTADNGRFKTLKNELDNDFLKGKDTYPKKMEDALRLMQNHKSVPEKTSTGRGKGG